MSEIKRIKISEGKDMNYCFSIKKSPGPFIVLLVLLLCFYWKTILEIQGMYPVAPGLQYNLVVHCHLLIFPDLHQSYPDLTLKNKTK